MTTVGLSISEVLTGEFVYFLYPSQVTLGNSANFEVTFENTGNINETVQIGIFIVDSSLNTVISFYDDNYTLRQRDTRNFLATWNPTSTGTYWVIVNASFNSSTQSNSTEQNASFEVVPAAAVPAVEAPVTGGGGVPAKAIVYNLILDYPEFVNLTQGESSIIPVYATNYGDTDLHNLSLSVTLEKIEWEIQPEDVSILPINSTAVFYISVSVPSGTLTNNYTLDFKLKTDRVTKSGQIIIVVYPVELCPEVERAIKNYGFLIDRMTVEIEKAISEKRDVSSTLVHLLDAKEELELAKKFYEANNCKEAKAHLELVRESLREVASELAKSIKPRVKLTIINIWWIVGVVLIVLVLIISVFVLMAKRRTEDEDSDEFTKLKRKWRSDTLHRSNAKSRSEKKHLSRKRK